MSQRTMNDMQKFFLETSEAVAASSFTMELQHHNLFISYNILNVV